MTQSREMAEKGRAHWDGVEVPGLVNIGERKREKEQIEVPGFNRKRKIPSGIVTVPTIELTYKIERGTNTLQFFEDFFSLNQEKQLTLQRTDAHGTPFARRIMQFCECVDITEPPVDLGAVDYAKIMVIILPWDYISISNS